MFLAKKKTKNKKQKNKKEIKVMLVVPDMPLFHDPVAVAQALR